MSKPARREILEELVFTHKSRIGGRGDAKSEHLQAKLPDILPFVHRANAVALGLVI